jgi:hypothetical protein
MLARITRITSVRGYPRDNSKTYSIVCQNRRTQQAAIERERELDNAETVDKEYQEWTDDEKEMWKMFSLRSSRSLYGRFR